MPNNITDVDTFTSPIQAPADGDPVNSATDTLGIQGLANRTFNLKGITQSYCNVAFSGTGIAGAGTPTVTLITQNGGWTVGSNTITIPATGVFEYFWRGNVKSSDTTNPSWVELNPRLNGSAEGIYRAYRYSASASDDFQLVTSTHIFSASASDQLTFRITASSSGTSSIATVDNNYFVLRQIS